MCRKGVNYPVALQELTAVSKLVDDTVAKANAAEAARVKAEKELNDVNQTLGAASAQARAKQVEVAQAEQQHKTLLQQIVDNNTKKAQIEGDLAAAQAKLAAYKNQGPGGIVQLITVEIDGVVSHPLGGNQVSLLDDEEHCKVAVKLTPNFKSSFGNMRAAGIKSFELVKAADGSTLDAPQTAWAVTASEFTVNSDSLCDRNRRALSNQEMLNLRVSFSDSDNQQHLAIYQMRYARPRWQWDLGIATYFAGSGISSVENSTMAVFPALKFGRKVNLPLGYENRDFYFQLNVIGGGGFAFPTGSEGNPKRLTVFAGGTFEIGKYLEVGYAYDIRNDVNLIVISPGRILAASILTF